MDSTVYNAYLSILKEELIPAMGCTEPIAIAYAAATVRKHLSSLPENVVIYASGNIIKNVKSVVVPNTNGMNGIFAAAAAGLVAGDAEKGLEVISKISTTQINDIKQYLKNTKFELFKIDEGHILDLKILAFSDNHCVTVRIADSHTNIVRIEKDGKIILDKNIDNKISDDLTERKILNVRQIIEFADSVQIDDIRNILEKQITYNYAIAKEGIAGNWGANIGKIILKSYENNVHNRARAYAAAGSDARMNGCELPVIINSGSGNQGITSSVPVIVYAEELKSTNEKLLRALTVSNLITIHLKTGIGKLSAYCGVISAGCGAAAGIAYLQGGKYNEIAYTIINGLAINSGVICDGAKPSCAAKIASAVEGGLLGLHMYTNGSHFLAGEGIVAKDVEITINNVGILAKEGMRETDKEIINIMINTKAD